MQTATFDLEGIVSRFQTSGSMKAITVSGSGLINDTHRIENEVDGSPDYLLQRINHQIFKDVPALMRNIVSVTSHLRNQLENLPDVNIEREVLRIVPTKNNGFYHMDRAGNYWRMYHFIPGTKSYNIVETPGQAFEGGVAFGRFQSMLSDLDLCLLSDSIPDFHNIARRLEDFYSAIQRDPFYRVKNVREEIKFVEVRKQAMNEILELGKSGILPKRVLHGDTKFNNVLLDENDKAQCVIDLDTVMVGYIAYDFGDAIRTIINKAAEDEKDLAKVQLNIPLFAAYTEGYLSQTSSFVTEQEVYSLKKGVLLLPYMQAVRFLTDYINGDVYYKTGFLEHNLQRTRVQLKLLTKLEEDYKTIDEIIRRSWLIYSNK